jgi:excisionase family DNA binding protein
MKENNNSNSYLEGIVLQLVNYQIELNRIVNQSQMDELKVFIEDAIDRKIKEHLGESQQEYYTREEAAKKLGVSLVTLDKYIKAGVLNAKRLGKSIRIEAKEINRCWKEIKNVKHKY